MDVFAAIFILITIYYLPTVVKGIYAALKRHRQNYRS
jgi:hypothetical protein